ncbi:MAG: signal peptide peptidase SppA [Phycisphaerae bacterium]|nr:signal peptide peptidase SppA [Phycisphaerae bacterium]
MNDTPSDPQPGDQFPPSYRPDQAGQAPLPRANPVYPGQPQGQQLPPPPNPPMYPPPWWSQPPRRSRAWIIFLVINLLGWGAFFVFIGVAVGAGGGHEYATQDIRKGKSEKIVAVVPLYDIVDGNMAQFAVRLLDDLAEDKNVCAVVLRIDTPGGLVSSSEQINRAVRQFKASSGKPILVSQGGYATSGGYYISVASDCIYSEPTTWTGNIGVIMTTFNARQGLEEKLGVKPVVIISKHTPFKEVPSMFKDMTPDQQAYLNGLVEAAYERFIDVIREGRPGLKEKTRDELRAIANGKVYTADEAKTLGLVDAIGYLDDAYKEAGRRAGVSNPTVTVYRPRGMRLSDLLASRAPLPSLGGKAANPLQQAENMIAPKVLYLYHNQDSIPSWPTMDYSAN